MVVGSGLIGSVIAWRLAQRGCAVTMVTGQWLGHAASHVAGGMLAPTSEATYTDTAQIPLNLASLRRFGDFAAELAEASGEDPGYYTHPTLAVAMGGDDVAKLRDFAGFLDARDLHAEMLTGRELRRREPLLAPGVRAGLLVDGDHTCDNRMLWTALMTACRNAGVQMRPGEVSELLWNGERACGVKLRDGAALEADQVVLAAGAWSGELPGVRIPVRPVKGQILRMHANNLPRLRCTVRAFCQGFEVYLVPRDHGELAIGATVEEQGFDERVTAEGAYTLLRDARSVIPLTAEYELCEIGVGWRPGTPDNAPILGPSGIDGLVLATGHYRNGVLLTPITGDVIASVVCDGTVPEVARGFTLARFEE